VHLLYHGQGGTANVDRAPAGALAVRPLGNRGLDAVMSQPVGDRGAGDARPDHQHALNVHQPIVAPRVRMLEWCNRTSSGSATPPFLC